MIEDSEEVWEKRDKAPEVGGGVVAPPAIRERDKSYSVRGLSVINYIFCNCILRLLNYSDMNKMICSISEPRYSRNKS